MYVIALAKARTPIAKLRVDHVDQSTRSWAPVEISMGGRASAPPPPHQKKHPYDIKRPTQGGGNPQKKKNCPPHIPFFSSFQWAQRGGGGVSPDCPPAGAHA